MPTRRIALSLLLGCFALASLSLPATAQAPDRLKVVATFSILADLVRQVGGERTQVTALVGPNGDAHVYAPTPADGRRLAEAQVVVANGLRFEGWIDRLIKSSGTRAVLTEAARGVTPLKAAKEEHGHSHAQAGSDPHAWQSIANAKIYIANIRDALIASDIAAGLSYVRSTVEGTYAEPPADRTAPKRKKGEPWPVVPNSSPITASRVRARLRVIRSCSSTARSASVTGVRSGLVSTVRSCALNLSRLIESA